MIVVRRVRETDKIRSPIKGGRSTESDPGTVAVKAKVVVFMASRRCDGDQVAVKARKHKRVSFTTSRAEITLNYSSSKRS